MSHSSTRTPRVATGPGAQNADAVSSATWYPHPRRRHLFAFKLTSFSSRPSPSTSTPSQRLADVQLERVRLLQPSSPVAVHVLGSQRSSYCVESQAADLCAARTPPHERRRQSQGYPHSALPAPPTSTSRRAPLRFRAWIASRRELFFRMSAAPVSLVG